jgi:hypothetical protein
MKLLVMQLSPPSRHSSLLSTSKINKRNYIYIPHYRFLVGKPEGKRPLGRPRRIWIDSIKMDLLEIGLGVVDWIGLAQDRYRWRALVNVFHKMLGNYRVAAQAVASRAVLSSTELVSSQAEDHFTGQDSI